MMSAEHLWTVLVLFHLWTQELAEASSLVLTNNGLRVGRGQTVYITENNLSFNIPRDRDSCRVELVLNEPTTQRVGTLSPQGFDCHFLPDEVKYSHNGSPVLDEDHVMLRVYRFSEQETIVESFIFDVKVIEPMDGIALVQNSLEVPGFYGISSKPLDKNILSFKPRPGTSCVVRTLESDLSLPAYGQVVIEEPKRDGRPVSGASGNLRVRSYRQERVPCSGNKACHPGLKEMKRLKTNCADFLEMGLKYEHLSPPSPDVDYIPLQIEYRSQDNRKQLQLQNIWIPVKISGAVPNTPPRAAFMPSFILEIDQFILSPLTTATLDAEDDETPKKKLVFTISKAPPQGYITHLDDQTKQITSFTWQDLHEMKIAYQPPNVTHLERRNYEVEFQAIDGHFLTSPPIMVHFSIRTAETNAPRVSWNMGLNLLEGQSRPITWDIFQIVDNDNIHAVRLVTVDGLHHGRLTVKGSKAFIFTVQDIRDGAVRYHHDDSDTTKDYIVFRIFDGRHSIRHKLPINILPKDDSPPFLVNNVGFEAAEGGAIAIERDMLMASDLDSSDDHILYNITRPPKAGELVKRYSEESPGIPVETFQQRDLFRGLIYYRHFGGEIFQDTFEFVLSDSHDLPNYSERQTVVIHIAPVKDQLPEEVAGTRRHISVKENEISRITRLHLHFTDTESPDSQLVYTITKPCYSVTSPGVKDAGKLISVDTSSILEKDPSISRLSSFTQHAVDHMKVAYMPPIQDIGPDRLHVQFEFSVSDQHGGRLTGLIFNITVIPVDDQAPKISTHPVRTEEGGSCLITGESLVISDEDTKSENLRILLKSEPRHGNVELRGVPIAEQSSFSLEELLTFKVRYQHDDSETLEDTIFFTVTDGTHIADGELKVQISPVNDEPPELRSNLKSTLSCPEGGHIYITAENLYATDPDSDDMRLTYMIARTPLYGMVQREGVMVEKFAQLDVIRGLISYRHTGGEIGAYPRVDTVTLIVSDGESVSADTCCLEGPPPPPIPLHASLPVYDLNITLTPINNQLPVIIIGDDFVVDEGFSSLISVNHVSASDVDTLDGNLTFLMETQPQFGYLESTIPSPGSEKSISETRIRSFSLQHVGSSYIRYVQSHHEHIEPTSDFFMISVTDSIHKSMIVPFYIIIKPVNDEEPQLHVRNITVFEGGSCEIGPATLSATDLDIPPDILRFSMVAPPAHGLLLHSLHSADISHYKQIRPTETHREPLRDAFTLDALKQGMTIVYTHDDTETRQDRFTLQLTDGKHTVQETLHIRVTPVNDEKPQLVRNGGLEVEVADNKVISPLVLEAEDEDSSRTAVSYIITSTPTFGELKKRVGSAWATLYAGMNFTQEDIDMNHIWYFHTIILGCKGHDSFRFSITDGEHNTAPQTFFISILNIEKGDIVLLTSPVTLTEGDRVTLMTDVLMATDGTGKPEKLLYAVSVPPVHGQIEYINFPGVPISSFSQLDVAAQKVSYVHDNSREAGKDSFSFTVSNGLKAKDGSLQFIIDQTDRIPPTLLFNKGLQILEGEAIAITPEVLQISDPDSPLEKLAYTIKKYPQHGQLYLSGTILQQNHFTQMDINNLYLSYQHYGGSGEIDRFVFTATDHTNVGFLLNGQLIEDSAVFTIQVNHVDKIPPKLMLKDHPSIVETMKDGRSAIQITARNLRASDNKDPDEDLVYVILRSPHFGHLENSKMGDHIGRTFTQREINQRMIRYIINPISGVTSDNFEFEISDSAGNKNSPEILELRWSVLELAESYYRICENAGTLAIKVIRGGSSKDPAFIGIKVQEISARLGQDFTHTSASLVQFDPGVSTKSWNIYMKNDGLEENHEFLKVILRTPKNAILGKITEATVEIVDPRQGRCGNQDSEPERIFYHAIIGSSRGHQPITDGRREGSLGPSPKITQILLPNPQVSAPSTHPASKRSYQRPGPQRRFTGSRVLGMTSNNAPQSSRRGDQGLVRAPLNMSTHSEERPLQDSAIQHSEHLAKQDEKPRICPAGWSLHQKSCYYLSAHQKSTWEDAERRCAQTDGSHMTSVPSEAAMKWLWKFADKKPFWIGLRRAGDPSSWQWTDGQPWTLSNFKKTESRLRESAENCVLVGRRREWQISGCGQRHRYICSFPL
ncbi:FRAS1-related extracellular matrix protein 1-like [Bufo gargarizans]|uniref:FRAS1-related extracellular matrix protein 1-like n=1 Tax=Bufo gargarizans TaxID=30331 RepID=UPI001CF29A22|nr:FRAS1-related extracellular matrix protein 1-like [Bufo gargarizans]